MSDALSDLASDQRRGDAYKNFLLKIAETFDSPKTDNTKSILSAAEECDLVKGGFWSSQTKLKSYVEKLLQELQEGNKQTWLNFLDDVHYNARWCWHNHQSLYILSIIYNNIHYFRTIFINPM